MSTLKADAITSAQDNTALTLSGTGTGGVKVNDFFVQTKGSDIASATSLTLGKDGNLFDVTGTTAITSIATQGIGSYVILHFDGALTFTHDSADLILPGAANITTAAGDIAVMYEYASADWRCVSYTKASGAAVVAGGGAWNIIGTAVASSSASLTITGLDNTYDNYVVMGSDLVPATDDVEAWIRLGDSSGVDSGSTDYYWSNYGKIATTPVFEYDESDAQINLTGTSAEAIGNATGEGIGFTLQMQQPATSDMKSGVSFEANWLNSTGGISEWTIGAGHRGVQAASSIVRDRVQFLFQSGNIVSGRLTVWGIAHA